MSDVETKSRRGHSSDAENSNTSDTQHPSDTVYSDTEVENWVDDDSKDHDGEEELPEVEEVISAVTVRNGSYHYRKLRRRTAQQLLRN